MKQITRKQMESLALREATHFNLILEYHQLDWIRDNARHIAAIETGRTNKTFYGEWPKGWKAEMKKAALESAKTEVIAKFKAESVFELDGALWLKDFNLIPFIAKETA